MIKYCSSFVLVISLIMLVGCNQLMQKHNVPELTFSHLETISLDVGQVAVKDSYQPPLQAPHVEHEMPTPLYIAVEKALQNSLIATNPNSPLRAEFVVEEASVKHQKLGGDDTFFAFLGKHPSDQYDAKLIVRVDVFDVTGQIGSGKVLVTRQKKMFEGASPNDKDQAFLLMTEIMIKDLDTALKKLLQSKFSQIVI